MLIELPVRWVIMGNVLGWPVIHLTAAWLATRLPLDQFDPKGWLFRARSWEREGEFYECHFAIKRWKNHLPDAAGWFRNGFSKNTLAGLAPVYLARFVQETCRSEAAHWMTMAATPIFFLWNYWWVDLLMIAYALLSNMPCILTQRYNRLRIARLLCIRKRREN